jgi:hypothetical protein
VPHVGQSFVLGNLRLQARIHFACASGPPAPPRARADLRGAAASDCGLAGGL